VSDFRESRRYIINPEDSRALKRWDIVMSVALLFVCFVTPFEVAFLDGGQGAEDFIPDWTDPLFWINRGMDLLFLADMIVQFFIMYPVSSRYGVRYISDRWSIVRHYIETWFFFDFISVLPFELIGILVSSGDVGKLRALRAVRLLRLVKLVRLIRGVRILNRWEVEMSFSYRKLTLWGLLTSVCLAAHWMSCVLGLLSSMQHACYGVAEDPPDCVVTWFTSPARMIVQQDLEMSSFRAYLSALHVTATILVHPYQATAETEADQVCFTILVFVGGFIWTRVISRTTAVQTSLDRHGIHHRQTMDDLNMNVRNLTLSKDLSKRLRSYFRNLRHTSQRNTWKDLTKRMSPSLQTEVAVELHKVWMRKVPFLAGSSCLLIADLVQRIASENFAQQETFGSNFRLYVMNRGVTSRNVGVKRRQRVMVPGTVWGLEHMVFMTANLLEPNTATAVTFVEVLVLTRDHFDQVKADFPENAQKIHRFYVKMTVIHGIIKYASDFADQNELVPTCSFLKTGRRVTIKDVFDLEDPGDSILSHQHQAHYKRMKREMSRMIQKYNKDSEVSKPRMTAPSVGADGLTLEMLEERLTKHIDCSFGVLAAQMDEFKRELREDLQAAGALQPSYSF